MSTDESAAIGPEGRLLPGALTATEVRDLLGTMSPIILNIGANIGQTVIEIFRAMPAATVHAFEPDPRALSKLRRNVSHPFLHVFECAIGAEDGTATFYQSSGLEHLPGYEDGWDQSGSIRPPRTHLERAPEIRFDRTISVPVLRLDTWAARHGLGDVDFIWADVQGAEADLIRGAGDVLARTRYLYTEYSDLEMYEGQPGFTELLRLLPDFEVVRRYAWDVLLRHRRLA